MTTPAGKADIETIRHEARALKALLIRNLPSFRKARRVELPLDSTPERILVLWEELGYSAALGLCAPDEKTAEKLATRVLNLFHKEDPSYPLTLDKLPRRFRAVSYNSDDFLAITDESQDEPDPAVYDLQTPQQDLTKGFLKKSLPSYLLLVAYAALSTAISAGNGVRLRFPGLKLSGISPFPALLPNVIRIDDQCWLVPKQPEPDAPVNDIACTSLARAIELIVQSRINSLEVNVESPLKNCVFFRNFSHANHAKLLRDLYRIDTRFTEKDGSNSEATHWLGQIEGVPAWVRVNSKFNNGYVAMEAGGEKKLRDWVRKAGLTLA